MISSFDAAIGAAGSLNTTWQQKGARITAPANAAKVRIRLMNYMNSGWVVYNKVSLKQVGVYNLTYDAENRLVGVSGAAAASFVYDGDSNRVKGIEDVTKVYIGNYFEWQVSNGEITRYYYAGSQRIAMRTGTGVNGLTFLLGDHLGSTSVSYAASTGAITRQLYLPWGEVITGTLPTDFTFTGQKSHVNQFGLMYYVARYYDPALGVFTQPDTIVPLASQGVQAWNRYAYVNDSPTNHVDPSGHACEDLPQGSREACINARERLDSPATSDPLPDEELTTVQKIGKGLTFTAVMVFIVAPTELALIDISIAAASSGPVGSVVDVLLLPVEITIADFAVSFGIKTYKEIESGQNVEFEWTILPALASDLPNPIQEELHKMLPRIFP